MSAATAVSRSGCHGPASGSSASKHSDTMISHITSACLSNQPIEVDIHVTCALGCRCASPGDRHLVPQAAVEVEVVALGLAGGGVADVGVQRVPVGGELTGATGPGDRADPARKA